MIGIRKSVTMDEAIAVVSNQITRAGKAAQLRFYRGLMGDDFAQQVRAKVIANAKGRKA